MIKSKFNVERDTHLHFENKPASWHFFIFLFALYSIVYMTKNCFNAALADIVNVVCSDKLNPRILRQTDKVGCDPSFLGDGMILNFKIVVLAENSMHFFDMR